MCSTEEWAGERFLPRMRIFGRSSGSLRNRCELGECGCVLTTPTLWQNDPDFSRLALCGGMSTKCSTFPIVKTSGN